MQYPLGNLKLKITFSWVVGSSRDGVILTTAVTSCSEINVEIIKSYPLFAPGDAGSSEYQHLVTPFCHLIRTKCRDFLLNRRSFQSQKFTHLQETCSQARASAPTSWQRFGSGSLLGLSPVCLAETYPGVAVWKQDCSGNRKEERPLMFRHC